MITLVPDGPEIWANLSRVAATELLAIKGAAAAIGDHPLPVMGVIDGYLPVDVVAVATHLTRYEANARKDEIEDLDPLLTAFRCEILPDGEQPQSETRLLDLNSRTEILAVERKVGSARAAGAGCELFVRIVALAQLAVQERLMCRVDVPFGSLEIVAVLKELANKQTVFGGLQRLIVREQRWLAGTHVRKDDPGDVMARVGALANLPVELAAGRLAGLLQAVSRHVIQPTVVEAAQTTIFDPAIAQVGAAVGAMQAQQAWPSALIAEQHQVLAEQADGQRRSARRHLSRKSGRLPVAAQQLAGRRARAGLG